MYSMVLMAALTTGTDLPDWGRRGWGCCGCWGGWGCYGWGCYGWGCYGWGCYGWGGWAGRGWGYGGWGYAYAPMVAAYSAPVLVSNTLPTTSAVTRSMYVNPATSANNRATIIVHLPETATLTVNGKPTRSTSGTRHFYSPPLEPGKNYHYTFTVQMERDGNMVKADRRVEVSAGIQRDIHFTMSDFKQSPERGQVPPQASPDEKKNNRERFFRSIDADKAPHGEN